MAAKRPREGLRLTGSSSAEEVSEWLSLMVPAFAGREDVLRSCSHIDGAALLALDEAAMKQLGFKAFGVRRKLTLCIKEMLATPPSSEEPAAAAAAPAAAAAAAPAPNPSAAAPVPAAAAAAARPVNLDHKAVEAQLNAEASCIGVCQWAAKTLANTIGAREFADWGSDVLKRNRSAALSQLSGTLTIPGASVVVVGNTGAGKSTLLNALIGESAVLPTNGMRACTAVIIELSYNHDERGPQYTGEVEFVSQEEWDRELEDLLGDLTTQEGRAILSVSDPDAHNYDSWCKLYAVYGDAYTHSTYDTGERSDTTGNKIYKALMVDDLKKKLKHVRTVTHKLGTTERVAANDPRQFRGRLERFLDSSNDVTAGQYWPIVKRCKARGRWDVLQSGCTFVDAPGVNDDNSSRDKVVKGYLKSADSIWIVSNINRAVNDKTAKDMLDHNFRQQLLMDGAYGSLVFVATQSDVLQRSEVQQSLQLPRHTSLAECAQARNDFTKQRIQTDFIDGLVEMGRASGDVVDRAELQKKFQLPVFCVSSLDHQKLSGVRNNDGPALVWSDEADTQVPALRKHVHRATLARRALTVRRQAEQLIQFGASMVAFCSDGGELKEAARSTLAAAFDAVFAPVPKQLESHLKQFDKDLTTQFDSKVAPRLGTGAAEASRDCLAKATVWGSSWGRNGGGQGGLHWATYKACCRREGEWSTNMNQELADPVLTNVSSAWESVFVSDLAKQLKSLTGKLIADVKQFQDDLTPQLLAAGIDEARLRSIRAPLDAALNTRADTAVDKVKEVVQSRQKDLSRSIAPMVQKAMLPGYQKGFAEAGTGSHRRRVSIVEGHIKANAKTMFKDAVEPVMKEMKPLRQGVQTLISSVVLSDTIEEIKTSYGMLWEATTDQSRRARVAMRPKLQLAVSEASTALNQLLRSQGATDQDAATATAAAARGESDDSDSEDMVEDMTDQVRSRHLQELKSNAIELLDDDASAAAIVDGLTDAQRVVAGSCSPKAAASAAAGGGASAASLAAGPVAVKAEKR